MACNVVKKIKGHYYLYEQHSFRVNGKVRTESRYLGPASPAQSLAYEQRKRGDLGTRAQPFVDTRFTSQKPFKRALSPQELYEHQTTPITDLRAFVGFDDLTVTTLDELTGRLTISRQFIQDLACRKGLKQAERDVLLEALYDLDYEDDKIVAQEFADQVKSYLLPLKAKPVTPLHESTSLDYARRGEVEVYQEIIYESPIKTPGAKAHFRGDSKHYFAHVRTEDLEGDEIRRVIEVQSDFFQQYETIEGEGLHPYRNTWHERIIREEIRRAALDGKKWLYLPTGRTIAYIEGFASQQAIFTDEPYPGDEIEIYGEDHLVIDSDVYAVQTIQVYDIERRMPWEVVQEDEIWYLHDLILSTPKHYLEEAQHWLRLEGERLQTFLEDPDDFDAERLARHIFDDRYKGPTLKAKIQAWAEDRSFNIGMEHVVVEDGQNDYSIYVLKPGGGIEHWDRYEEYESEFDPDSLGDNERRVYTFYERDLAKTLKRLKRTTDRDWDDYGNEWYALPIRTKPGSPNDAGPVRAYKSRGQRPVQPGHINQVAQERVNLTKKQSIENPPLKVNVRFAGRYISEEKLHDQYDAFMSRLQRTGLDPTLLAPITITYGSEVSLKRTRKGLVVTLPRRDYKGINADFRRAFSKAVVRAGLDAMKNQAPKRFLEMQYFFDESFRKTQQAITAYMFAGSDQRTWFKLLALKYWGNVAQMKRNFLDASRVGLINLDKRKTWQDELVTIMAAINRDGFKKTEQKFKAGLFKARTERTKAWEHIQENKSWWKYPYRVKARKRFMRAEARVTAQQEMLRKLSFLHQQFYT